MTACREVLQQRYFLIGKGANLAARRDDPPQKSAVLTQRHGRQGAQPSPSGGGGAGDRMINSAHIVQLDKRCAGQQRFSNRVADARKPSP